MKMHYVYIIYSERLDKYYVGYTHDVRKRILQHNSESHPFSKFTSKEKDWELVYKENYDGKREAIKREKQIKAWKSRLKIERLICNAG